MDARDKDLIERLLPEDEELQRLWREHRQLEGEIDALRQVRFPTPEEDRRCRELQKIKLAGRDRIQTILSRHR